MRAMLNEFNDASAVVCALYWCQVLDIRKKDRYRNNKRAQMLALLTSHLVNMAEQTLILFTHYPSIII